MNNEQIKELIKLKTEFLKFYFILVIAVVTGVLTLLLRHELTALHKALVIVGFVMGAVVLFLIFNVRAEISKLVERLNQSS